MNIKENSRDKITGVTAKGDILSVVGVKLNSEIKDKIVDILEKNNIKYKEVSQTKMSISFKLNECDINKGLNCIHDMFF